MKSVRMLVPVMFVALWLGSTASAQILSDNFGWQCGFGKSTNCPITGGVLTWPTSPAMPDLLRLHDSGTEWSVIVYQQESNSTVQGGCLTQCNWSYLDAYLDALANHQPRAAVQTFTSVPCWDSTTGTCGIIANYPNGTNGLPSDLTSSGSPSFNAFVTAFVQHCSPAGNCVSQYIKGYDLWNEWDLNVHWLQGASGCGTTISQCAQTLYNMLAPAVTIIQNNVSNAVILMPSTTPASSTYQCDLAGWLGTENTNGRISNLVNWHLYLTGANGTTNTPEYQWANYAANYRTVQNSNSSSYACGGATYNTTGWSSAFWADTETNFTAYNNTYACPSSQYSETDCAGQIARWQLLHDSNSAVGLYWYYGNTTIGNGPTTPLSYATVYENLQTYLIGGKFTGACSSTGTSTQTWSCNFTEGSGTKALFLWACTTSGGYCTATTSTTNYTVPSGYVDYKDLYGNTTTVTANQVIQIGADPILLEK